MNALGGKVIIDSSQRQETAASDSPPIGLQTGVRYPIQFRYFNAGGKARARLLWSGPNTPRGNIPKDRLYAMVLAFELVPGDRHGLVFPFTHIGGLGLLMAALISGCSHSSPDARLQ